MLFSPMDSQNWVIELCKGEAKAYKFFFEEYYQILGVFALKYVKEKEVAADIVNDVILELYSRKLKFENLTALKSFLYLSIKNKSLNYIRHSNAQERYLHILPPEKEEEFFLDNIIEEEIYFLMKKAIADLPVPIRQIYELSLQGKSNEEIAQQLGITLDSVKSYKKRGKSVLRDKLKGLMYFLSVGF